MPELPDWWDWPFRMTLHAEFRMEERGLGEVQLRMLLERPQSIEPTTRHDRWKVVGRVQRERWAVLLEPDPTTKTVLVITVFMT